MELGEAWWGWPGRPSCKAAAASPKAAMLVGGIAGFDVAAVVAVGGGTIL